MKDKEIKIVEQDGSVSGGIEFNISPEAALKTVQQGLGIDLITRDLLIKSLDEIKIKHKVQKPGTQVGKDEHGIPKYADTKEEIEEVLSDYQKGFVILAPETHKEHYKAGDIVIYRLKAAQMFDWKEGLFLVQPYDVVGKMIKK
jgi:hypothetical protein